MATIKDIAKRANVSIATVSMVLNGKDCITKKTRDKVLAAAKELNYIPSIAAKTLKTNRSHTIALFVGDISNPFFPEIVKGVEAAARIHNYSVIIYDLSGDDQDFVNQIGKAASQKVDGMYITGATKVSEQCRQRLLEAGNLGIKIISSNRDMDWGLFPMICTDESEPIDAVLSKMVAYGHRHIGCISAKLDSWVARRREQFFQNSLEQYGLYRPEYVEKQGFLIEDGRLAVKNLLNRHPEITAVMCINDTLAIGANAGARESGRRVPQDLSIFGIDGIECLQYFYPRITTVDTYRYQYGFDGTERLIRLIEGENPDSGELMEELYYKCSVIHGDTVTPPA